MKTASLILPLLWLTRCWSATSSPRIAVIGGGIGGTSCSYYLRSLFGDAAAVDLYEAEDVGGRLSVVTLGGRRYEVGGSIIHTRNRYMAEFLNLFKLSKRQQAKDSYFGLYNGRDFVFKESEWQLVTLFRLVKRYHLGFWKLRNHINHMLDNFERIYGYQAEGMTFNNVSALLSAMDTKFVDYLTLSAKRGFEEEGLSNNVINELVMATLRTNYGQDLNVHKFVGSVSVAGASGGLWAFNGGNAQVPAKLLHLSQAQLIPAAVTTVRRLDSGEMEVLTSNGTGSARTYDIVVVATPQTSDMKHRIRFDDFDREIRFPGRYHQTVCTLIRGTFRGSYFRDKAACIDAVLSVDASTFFNSIGRIFPVDYRAKSSEGSDVWKVFSPEPLTESQVSALFSDVREKYVKVWLAYPEYDTSPRSDDFVLDADLYHVNAIDWAASSMEMSVIGAKNVALLAYNNWCGRGDRCLGDAGAVKDEL